MPKVLVTTQEIIAVLQQQPKVEIDGVEHMDALGLIDALRTLVPGHDAPARPLAAVAEPNVVELHPPAPTLQVAPTPVEVKPAPPPPVADVPACKWCGSTEGRVFLEPDPEDDSGNDSAFCKGCGRHWRTGKTREAWQGARVGLAGPAPPQVPPAPLGVEPGLDDVELRMATPPAGHRSAAQVYVPVITEDGKVSGGYVPVEDVEPGRMP